jgi:hypothetical protein
MRYYLSSRALSLGVCRGSSSWGLLGQDVHHVQQHAGAAALAGREQGRASAAPPAAGLLAQRLAIMLCHTNMESTLCLIY